MPIIRDLIQAFTKSPNTRRLPESRFGSGFTGGTFGVNPSRIGQLSASATNSWLFAVIERISEGVAAAEWQLHRRMRNGERELVEGTLLNKLWDMPNPFTTNDEFLLTLGQHYELVGEMWILILRHPTLKIPLELWPIRPDRIKPVPHPQEFISGYVYQVGSERIPLEVDDIIFIRRPSPVDPYRGIGVVQSLLVDLGSDRAAAMYTNRFFANDATPGGIIELDESLQDDEFNKIVEHWREQHRGVENAHRVAFLERGKWVERKFSNRDIQLKDLRSMSRDLILGAFGMPAAMLGISENVNRANALAAETMFSRWIVVPRLRKIRAALNERLAPMFGEGLEFDFIDPTPENREQNLLEAEGGYEAGILSQNEARELLNHPAVPDGDTFREPLPPQLVRAFESAAKRKLANPLWPDELDIIEAKISDNWANRLVEVRDDLIEYIGTFE